MLTEKPRLDPSMMGEANILVEVELDNGFPNRIATTDKKKRIVSLVDVEYKWIPSNCGRCGRLGHKESRCLLQNQTTVVNSSHFKATNATIIPVVDVVVTSPKKVVASTVVPVISHVTTPTYAPPAEEPLELT